MVVHFQEGPIGALGHTVQAYCVEVLGVFRGGQASGADLGLIPTVAASTVARQAGPGGGVGVVAGVATGRAQSSLRIVEVREGSASRNGAIFPRVDNRLVRIAVADAPRAEPILRAPVRAEAARVRAEVLEHRALDVTLNLRDRLVSALVNTQAVQLVHPHCEHY